MLKRVYPGKREAQRKIPCDRFLDGNSNINQRDVIDREQGPRHGPRTKRQQNSDVTMACDSHMIVPETTCLGVLDGDDGKAGTLPMGNFG